MELHLLVSDYPGAGMDISTSSIHWAKEIMSKLNVTHLYIGYALDDGIGVDLLRNSPLPKFVQVIAFNSKEEALLNSALFDLGYTFENRYWSK
jgi:hypothetical protein